MNSYILRGGVRVTSGVKVLPGEALKYAASVDFLSSIWTFRFTLIAATGQILLQVDSARGAEQEVEINTVAPSVEANYTLIVDGYNLLGQYVESAPWFAYTVSKTATPPPTEQTPGEWVDKVVGGIKWVVIGAGVLAAISLLSKVPSIKRD